MESSQSALRSPRASVRGIDRNTDLHLVSNAPSESRVGESLDPIWLSGTKNKDLPRIRGSGLLRRSVDEPSVDVVDAIVAGKPRSRVQPTRSALRTIDQAPS